MGEAKYTPAPWSLEDHGYTYIVAKPGDGYITRDVCRMDHSTMSALEQASNARLIAAAPELLEVLEEIVALSDREGVFSDMQLAAARRVIAKAKYRTEK